LIKRAETALIPGLSAMIDIKESATPLTNRRYTGNTDGAIYGFEQSMDNACMNRISNRNIRSGLAIWFLARDFQLVQMIFGGSN
jgi:phytoene dehydrogenase-like protein